MRLPARLPTASRAARARGLSLVELIIFIVVVGAALAGTLRVFTQSTAASADPLLRRQALAIAESLLEEIELMPLTFCDADDANLETTTSSAGCASLPDAIGPEAGEGRFATPQFDHVDDYHGYTMNGIVDITGAAVNGLGAYRASVGVAAAALGSVSAASGDALRITVTVTGPANTSVSLDGYRTRHAPQSPL
ncbi:type IV pilus modification PilV family protein [Piscinibacter defluvii]|uniref:type IV pilus modification PilV family protein n=1 Tax=Piscinibacter defluvii TaxID=1796922 RepID=UPI000FDEA387|nr:type II secretion system protein [Piscinibacter defluvii]